MARHEVFTTIRSEGGLLPTDLLARVRESGSGLPGTTPEAYHLAPNERLNEAITRSWNRLVGAWKAFEPERAKAGPTNVATGATRQHWLLPLFQELGFGQVQTTTRVEIGEKEYPISHRWGAVPIHLVGTGVELDRRSAGVRGAAAMSPHGMVQELLNRSEDYLWGIVSNGLVLRLLRDNSSLTRPAYLQFDLEAMFDGEVFADFVVLWLTCHQSRFEADIPEKCLLEAWVHEAVERGTRALDQLRVGVEEAIASLGEGFLAHPANVALRSSLEGGDLDKQEYYRELLRLVYRLLFLLVTESRDLLLMPDADETVRARYRDHYGVERLRSTADQVRGGPHGDQWQSLQLVFAALGRVDGEPALGLPGLGGFLWERRATPHIGECHLANEHLFRALRALSMVQDGKVRRRVDYGDLDSQELGSVYESLLELHPVLDVRARSFSLSTAGGNERKTTGAYYTPDELVEELLDSALDPVLDEAEAAEDPEKALLDVTVLDPACGSGHFLIAAGRRIATRLARVRAEAGEPSPAELTTAMRDVVGRCLHGIDIQEMAVELCKVSLWMAAAEPGKPLSFLEHRIVCGNGLLGTTPRLIAEGIPDEAFKPLTGDDKEVVKAWKAINKKERQHPDQLQMTFSSPEEDLLRLTELTERLDSFPDDDLTDLEQKEQTWSLIQHGAEMARAKFAADAWCAAFVAPKTKGAAVITTRVVAEAERRLPSEFGQGVAETVTEIAKEYRFVHPHLAFPHVFRASEGNGEAANSSAGWSGGFSVVLGNPPWERVKLQEQEFFAERRPEIAGAANASARKRLIESLAGGDAADQALYHDFQMAVRRTEGEGLLLRGSGRYPMCGRGDVNTYAVFTELMSSLLAGAGHQGIVVPLGIATDDTTRDFFAYVAGSGRLSRLAGFENEARIFPGVHNQFKFCLLTITGNSRSVTGEYSFFARAVSDLSEPSRTFKLSADDFHLLNPNTRTCPVFRTRRDAEITKAVYRRVPVLVNENSPTGDPWGVHFQRMFDMSNDSGQFKSIDDLLDAGGQLEGNIVRSQAGRHVPFTKRKMFHLFNHRLRTYLGQTRPKPTRASYPSSLPRP
ncbi:MAG: DNA methyltransferase [Acidimicrobiales bacterium]